jgi:hypothetical protein
MDSSTDILDRGFMEEVKRITTAVCKSPSGHFNKFFNCLCSTLEKIYKRGKGSVILSDLTVNITDNGSCHNQLLNISNSYEEPG